MEVIEEKQNDIYIIKPKGRLDSNTSPEFEKKIFEIIEKGSRNMIIDFESLDYVSSAGLRVILKVAKQLKHSDGRVILCSMEDYVKEVFEIAGFDSIIPIVPNRGDALKNFEASQIPSRDP
ncbi:MAG: STAS domain-containing protein [Desulfobacterales bacterium]|nr:STAS domain-containing protein [Desulfobacterales bacterium]